MGAAAAQAAVRVVRCRGLPVLRMLRLEEALLRKGSGCWALVNDGAPEPTVVLGISGKPREMLEEAAVAAAGVRVLRRFSGGGTVVADADTVFVSLIMDQAAVASVPAFPRPLMEWSEGMYRPLFGPHAPAGAPFSLTETDYVYGRRKFGGNAQAITRGRWCHHTSFLWDYRPELMRLLKYPPKTPEYRRGRAHRDFVGRLRDVLPSRQTLVDGGPWALEQAGFRLEEARLEEAEALLDLPHLRSTRELEAVVRGDEGVAYEKMKP